MLRPVLVLGIDPGTHHLGWGVIVVEANRVRHVAHGVLHAPAEESLAGRLVVLSRGLQALIAAHKPQASAVESLFFHKDPQAASKLGHARGVVLLHLAQAEVPIAEYAPALVKSTVTGNGRAEKKQVAQMIKMLLNLSELPPADAADALAIAVTHTRRAALDALLRDPARQPVRDLKSLLKKRVRRVVRRTSLGA
jgi:crossover junction endodeoxyribonuclease RuvC